MSGGRAPKRKGKSPTARTLEHCRKLGWTPAVVERQLGPFKKDAFGFGDVLVITDDGLLLIQATSDAHHADRVTKILEQCTQAATDWLMQEGRIEVWSWGKRGKRGKRKTWQVRRESIYLGRHDLEVEPVEDMETEQ